MTHLDRNPRSAAIRGDPGVLHEFLFQKTQLYGQDGAFHKSSFVYLVPSRLDGPKPAVLGHFAAPYAFRNEFFAASYEISLVILVFYCVFMHEYMKF